MIKSSYKELPQLTKNQENIIDFWGVRGYDEISHALGMLISLHKNPRYESLGLSLQYLEQFKDENTKEIESLIQKFNDCRGDDDDWKHENALYDWLSKRKAERKEREIKKGQ